MAVVGHVLVKDGAYGPSLLTIPVGGVVTWQNVGADVCSLAGRGDPLLPGVVPHIRPQGRWTLTFGQAGTYTYGCDETRPSDASAQIVVDPAATAAASGTATPAPGDAVTPTDGNTATASPTS